MTVHIEILQDIPARGLVLLVNEPIGVVNGIDEFTYLWLNFRCILRDMWQANFNTPAIFWLAASLLLCSGNAFSQNADSDADEPAAIVELGGAGSWNLKGGSSFGADIAAEITPIENWLELEAGVTPLFAHHSTEWDTDFLFKKPWTLSKKLEFMIGIGPEWVHTRQDNKSTNALAGEAMLDFMFWPSGKHRFGWYCEPSYEYTFGHDHERSIGITGGLLIGIGKPSKRSSRSRP